MTTIGPNDFDELMPHLIVVKSKGGVDNYGKPVPSAESRTYKCLFTESERVRRTVEGITVASGEAAYCNPIPLGYTSPVDILDTDTVTITSPPGKEKRPVTNIERFYDETGGLYSLVVRFS